MPKAALLLERVSRTSFVLARFLNSSNISLLTEEFHIISSALSERNKKFATKPNNVNFCETFQNLILSLFYYDAVNPKAKIYYFRFDSF